MQFSVSDVDNILIPEDIEGFIEMGAPADEYQDEAAQIAAAVSALGKEEFNKKYSGNCFSGLDEKLWSR
jgi:predicted nucleotide-binding protein